MLTDLNKNISSTIRYNHLNLPVEIVFENTNKISYVYDAEGRKLEKNIINGTVTTTTKYMNGFQYLNAVLQFFPTVEGYVKKTGNAYFYVFNYTDHLGNIRMSYSDNNNDGMISLNEIIDTHNYYPFGLEHSNATISEFKYKFQGQERQDELGLNWDSFKWRNYDPAIGRFMCIDPLSEKYNYQSTYNFAENRVIDGRELEGLEWASIKNNDGTTTRQLTVQMYNNSSLTDKQVAKATETMKADFAKTYSDEGASAQLVVNNVTEAKGDFVVTLIDTQSNTLYDKNTGEEIGKTYAGGQTGTLGETQKNNFEVTVTADGSKRSNSDISRSFSHEAGHTAGLEHPWSASNPVSDIRQGNSGVKDSTVRSNLMNSDQNPSINNRSTSGTSLTTSQIQSIDKLIKIQTKSN